MTKFQRLTTFFMAAICLAVVSAAALYAYRTLAPSQASHEEQLAAACEAHPADCALMKRVNVATEATVADAMRFPNADIKAQVNELYELRRRMEDKFIATGKYGD